MLDDYAFGAEACISIYEITGEDHYISAAKSITDRAISKFYDVDKELFYFNEANELIVRTSEVRDNVIPATNSAMANVMHSLGLIYGETKYLNISENLIGKVQQNMVAYAGGHSNWGRVLLKHTLPYYEIAIVGPKSEILAKQLMQLDLPNVLLAYTTTASEIPLMKDRFSKGKTSIYVCERGVCQLPVNTIAEALKIIEK
jgi:hypothetical protein